MPFAWALVFGALISPTDPLAVLSTLKAVRVPETLEIDMTGESLFNDGVGIVIFTVLMAAGRRRERRNQSSSHLRTLFIEALGALCSASSAVMWPIERCVRSTTIRSRF